ncbi:MAG: YlmC/YmxH family sporulation protein [Lachnospiraceae bacterium]|nr:YlmC/YmxH family sporulation protein [Lachnospiraceae bacterium]
MRFSEFTKKEVVNISDGKCLGCVSDLLFDECQGRIQAMVIRGPARWFHCIGIDSEYIVNWDRIVRIGPDVILVEVCAEQVLRKL